jgi:hypothetical protein
MTDRVTYDDHGNLDEVVAGGAHLENMDRNRWFLSMTREDGSQFCVWFAGEIASTEERKP